MINYLGDIEEANVIVNREFVARCAGCHEPLNLFEYRGLEGSIYGPPHLCPEIEQVLRHDDQEAEVYYGLKEISRAELPGLA